MHRKPSPKKANKLSPEARPRRRASQTYIFKYQLANNPLKAEEDDLKLAILASLEQGAINEKNPDKFIAETLKKEPGSNVAPKIKSPKKEKVSKLSSKHDETKKTKRSKLNDDSLSIKQQKTNGCIISKLTPKKNKIFKSSGEKYTSTNGRQRDKCTTNSTGDKSNNNHTATPTTTSKTQPNHLDSDSYSTTAATAPYSIFASIQKKEPPNEDYLKKYKPETEDFLTFICFRTTAPNYNSSINAVEQPIHTNGVNGVDGETGTNTKSNGVIKHGHSLKKRASPSSTLYSLSPSPDKLTQSSNDTIIAHLNGDVSNDHHQSNNVRRRPIRQSPRLATRQSKRYLGSNKKISEYDHSVIAYDNSIDYEEELKRASIALEDMAQEINSSDNLKDDSPPNHTDAVIKSPSGNSSMKNNRHLVKGLMTREFAGAFADEETIFESISNHKL